VIFSQDRQVNFSRTVWITFHCRGTTSKVSVIGSCSRSSAALFTRRSRPAHRAPDRRSDRGLAWTAHDHFRDRALRVAYGDHGPPCARLAGQHRGRDSVADCSSRLRENSVGIPDRGGPSGPNPEPKDTGQALASRAGVHGFRVPSLRSGPGMTAIWAFFQQRALAVSAAPTMSKAAAEPATAGVSEACATPLPAPAVVKVPPG
jgi:hypothetical protein